MPLNTFTPTVVARISGKAGKAVAGGNLSFLLSHESVNRLTVADCDQLYSAEFSIASSGTLTLDLSGVLASPFSETVALLRVIDIMVEHYATSVASSLQVGTAVANQVPGLPLATLLPGEFVLKGGSNATGTAVTAGTGDLYKLTNLDGSHAATGRITILGRTT